MGLGLLIFKLAGLGLATQGPIQAWKYVLEARPSPDIPQSSPTRTMNTPSHKYIKKKNPIQHCSTKHIEIRYRFLRDRVHQGNIKLVFLPTNAQLTYLFIKPLESDRCFKLRHKSGHWSMSHIMHYFLYDMLCIHFSSSFVNRCC